jgi:hypothetical protein
MAPPKKKPDEQQTEQYHPMAVPEPGLADRLDAMAAEMKVMKDWINQHSRHHTGKNAI